jgi:hypothetical protein
LSPCHCGNIEDVQCSDRVLTRRISTKQHHLSSVVC